MKKLPDYKSHSIANVFPLVSDAEIDELAEDIKANGLTFPIVLYEGKILDGRNRYLACQKAGITPEFWEYPGDTPIQFVLSLNLHRRHLTISQRAAVAVELATLPQGARTDIASNEARFSQSQAGDAMGVSRSSVQRAREVKEADPELHEKVKAGEVSMEDARRKVDSGSNGDHDDEKDAEEKQSKEQIPVGVAEESRDRGKCITQFKVFVRDLSKELHRSQKEIKDFVRLFLSY